MMVLDESERREEVCDGVEEIPVVPGKQVFRIGCPNHPDYWHKHLAALLLDTLHTQG